MSSATSPPFVPSAMLAALISGCFGSMSSAGPTHSPTEEAQWPELEQRARQLALAGGEELALPAQRLAKTGFAVEQPIEVAANTCYTAGVA